MIPWLRNMRIFSSLFKLLFHIGFSFCSDLQASAFRTFISLFFSLQLPRYLKSCSCVSSVRACFMLLPSSVIITSIAALKNIDFVFFAFILKPIFLHSCSTLFSSRFCLFDAVRQEHYVISKVKICDRPCWNSANLARV